MSVYNTVNYDMVKVVTDDLASSTERKRAQKCRIQEPLLLISTTPYDRNERRIGLQWRRFLAVRSVSCTIGLIDIDVDSLFSFDASLTQEAMFVNSNKNLISPQLIIC